MSGGKNLHMEVGISCFSLVDVHAYNLFVTVVQIGVGDLANRIITVGSVSRLEKIVQHFDNAECRCVTSSRGFTTATGSFNGVPVSVVAIGMVRENYCTSSCRCCPTAFM